MDRKNTFGNNQGYGNKGGNRSGKQGFSHGGFSYQQHSQNEDGGNFGRGGNNF
jgi:hypothetical protein